MIRLVLSALSLVLAITGDAAAADVPLVFNAGNVGGPNSGAAMELWRPSSGGGPFAAVVVLHDCGGVSANHRSWAARLASYLRTLPDIQADRIGVVGNSHGGNTVLQAAQADRVQSNPTARPFQAAVAYYPGCNPNPPWRVAATDVLILIGKDDDWTLAANCEKQVIGKKDFPHPPRIKVYPGAIHGFDMGGLPRWTGDHMVGGNAGAAADSFAMTKAFLDDHLKGK
ncbi:MAG TPA: dienelactone hydrolase family protein [Reyranella sp.]|jgi:dienelactone hydrolase|nr:dienelactone hydrolase family protein [Reyranella sp.]